MCEIIRKQLMLN